MNNIKINQFLFYTFPSYLIIALPILLITGPFLSDLALTLIGVIFVINSLVNKIFFYYKNFFLKSLYYSIFF